MSTGTDTAVETVDRSVAATRRLCASLGLGTLKPKDLKQLAIALSEAASTEVERNPDFRDGILTLYRDLTTVTTPKRPGRTTKRTKEPAPHLTVKRQVDPHLFGPDRPLDPYLLQYVYGDDQLRAALSEHPASELKKAAAMVELRNPGTKPANRAQKPALVEYILTQLVGQPHQSYDTGGV